MLIGWSGHRPDLFRHPHRARSRVEELAEQIARGEGGVEFVCGAQRGVDTWAASAAQRLGLPLHLVLPLGLELFTNGWRAADRRRLLGLVSAASSVIVIDPEGRLGPLAYDLRNEHVARRAQMLVVVWTGLRRGGTFHTMCAARRWATPVRDYSLEGTSRGPVLGRGL
jgi:hypothetical protein